MTLIDENGNIGDEVGEFTPPLASAAQPSVSDQNEKRQIVINAGTNAGVMVAKVVLVFFVSPILVHGLGDTRYGIWVFVSSITAYLALGNFGIKSAVMRFVARYNGLKDDDSINRVVNTSSAVLAAVAVVVLAITFLAAWLWRSPLGIPGELAGETRWFFVLSGTLVAMLLVVSVPQSLLAGLGRFPIRNAISVLSLVLRNALLVGVVWCGGNLVAVGMVLIGGGVLDFGALSWAARRCFPRLAYSYRYVDREMLRIVCGYGANVFAGDVAFLVMAQSAPLIIGAVLMSPDQITYFSLGGALTGYALSILGMVVFVLTPAVSKWQAMGNDPTIRSLLIHATRYALYFIAPIEFGLFMFGHPFLALWMGPRYADAGYATLAILSVPLLLAAVGMVSSRILLGVGRVRPLAIITAIQAVLTVGLSLALVRPFGIEGVASGISLALALCIPATVILACRYIQMSVAGLLRRASLGPLSATSVAVLVWIIMRQWVPIDNWGAFLGVGVLGMAPYSIIVMVLERDVRRVAGAIARRGVGLLSTASRVPAGWLGIGKN